MTVCWVSVVATVVEVVWGLEIGRTGVGEAAAIVKNFVGEIQRSLVIDLWLKKWGFWLIYTINGGG